MTRKLGKFAEQQLIEKYGPNFCRMCKGSGQVSVGHIGKRDMFTFSMDCPDCGGSGKMAHISYFEFTASEEVVEGATVETEMLGFDEDGGKRGE